MAKPTLYEQLFFDTLCEELAANMRTNMEEVWQNLSNLGVDNENIVNYVQGLVQIEKKVRNKVYSEVLKQRIDMLEEINKLKNEARELIESLSINDTVPDISDDSMLSEYKNFLENLIDGYKEQHRHRVIRTECLREWRQDLVDKLAVTIPELEEPLPREEELDCLEKHLELLQVKRNKRAEKFLIAQIEIKDIMRKLQIEPCNEFEESVVVSLSVDFVFTDVNMDRVAELHQDLVKKYEQAKNRVLQLRETLTKLWDCLEVDQIYREQFLDYYPGCHPFTEAAINKEIKRLDLIKNKL